MSKISIIIPVYNTGKYLQRCIDSIIRQTYKDLDVIIVDDGSQSETSNICDSIAKSDYRIRVFHKQNEGVSVARNYRLVSLCTIKEVVTLPLHQYFMKLIENMVLQASIYYYPAINIISFCLSFVIFIVL